MPPQLTRLFIIFAGLGVMFIVVTWVAEPASFGWYGHYRADALAEAAARTTRYVPRDACAECHEEEAKLNKDGVHSKISCQSCHGPGDKHIEEPSTENIVKPVVAVFCLRCHEASYARPKNFPQIVVAEHAEGKTCDKCHVVHDPGMMVEEKAEKDSLAKVAKDSLAAAATANTPGATHP
jgi:hypothetical protein